VVAGAAEAASDGIDVVLFGPDGLDTGGLELSVAADRIDMAEKPAEAVRAKPDSSLVAAVRAVADGDADAVVSAGNTGAMLAAGLRHMKRVPGVMRPAIAVPLPTRAGGVSVLIDAGANADNRPEHLLQFAHMGSVFAHELFDVERPEVRLLSIGEEPEKGNQLTLEAHDLLREAEGIEFAGNAEGRELLRGTFDVFVTDGFTGNMTLKVLEGAVVEALGALRDEITATARGKLGGLLIRPAARRLRDRLDPDTYGGAYLLGLQGLAVIAHGNSGRTAIANAVRLAARGAEHRLVERLADRMPARERRTESPRNSSRSYDSLRSVAQLECVKTEAAPLGGSASISSPRVFCLPLLVRGDVVDCLSDRRDLLGVIVGDLDSELVLQLHDQLDEIQ
jgi:glycerol-3-phosphate acyltransferase PlsX